MTSLLAEKMLAEKMLADNLAADNALEEVANWVRQHLSAIPPWLLILIGVAIVALVIFGLVKKLLSLLLVIAIIMVIITGLWILAEPTVRSSPGPQTGSATAESNLG